jgi:hypothetical protein
VDVAGNRSEALAASYILDNVAPRLTVTGIVDTAPYTPSLTVLTGTVTDGGAVSVSVLVESDGVVYREPAVLEGDTWRYTLQPASPGLYTLRISAYDAAGNVANSGPLEVQVSTPQFIYLPFVARTYTSSGE